MQCFGYEQNKIIDKNDWKYKVKLNMLGIQTILQLNITIHLKYQNKVISYYNARN